jgi:P pilus assembly chaperone PapD
MSETRSGPLARWGAALSLGLAVALPAAAAVTVGQPAPEFTAASTAGPIPLADYRGKKNVLLAFYYKDFTGG